MIRCTIRHPTFNCITLGLRDIEERGIKAGDQKENLIVAFEEHTGAHVIDRNGEEWLFGAHFLSQAYIQFEDTDQK